MKNKTTIKKSLVLLLIILTTLSLSGCVTQKKKITMFNMLKEEGFINVGDRSWDEYDEEKVVNMSPIPANAYYYIYKTDDVTYTISYRTATDDKEDTDTFKAFVMEEGTDGGKATTTVYKFENRKVFWIFWKMYFVGIDS